MPHWVLASGYGLMKQSPLSWNIFNKQMRFLLVNAIICVQLLRQRKQNPSQPYETKCRSFYNFSEVPVYVVSTLSVD